MKGKEAILIKRAPLYKILLQSGTRSWVQSPSDKRRGHRKCLWWADRKCVWSSDEGDPYRDGRRLCPVLRGLMGHHMFHHRVFSHVLYEVRLLGKKTTKEEINTWAHIFAAVQILNIRLAAHRGVCPATEAAAVGLGILDGVCGKVDLQGGRVRVGTVTVGTFEGFVFVVLPLVRLEQRRENKKSVPFMHHCRSCEKAVNVYLQIRQLCKSLFTSWVSAFIRPVACVDPERGNMIHTERRLNGIHYKSNHITNNQVWRATHTKLIASLIFISCFVQTLERLWTCFQSVPVQSNKSWPVDFAQGVLKWTKGLSFRLDIIRSERTPNVREKFFYLLLILGVDWLSAWLICVSYCR